MRVDIDQTGRDPAIIGVDFDRIGSNISLADPLDLAFGDIEVSLVKAAPVSG